MGTKPYSRMKKSLLFLAVLCFLVVPLTSGKAIADDEHRSGKLDTAFTNSSPYSMLQWVTQTTPDYRILYEINSLTYGDLRIPKSGNAPENGWPVVIYVHGGAWTDNWGLNYMETMVEAMTSLGVVTWNIEFRRIGSEGGGWPGTFLDVANATDFLRELAPIYNLDLNRVIAAGHSSGGHLVLWLGSRHVIPEDSPLYMEDPLLLAGVLSHAGIPDLERALTLGNRTDTLVLLGDVTPEEAQELYDETSPTHMLPTGTPTSHIVGTKDNPWRITITEEFVELAEALGDEARITIPENATHFDILDPCAPGWPITVNELLILLGEDTLPLSKFGSSKFCPVSGR